MSYREGVVWVGGSETPPAQGANHYTWWLWNTRSQNPCSTCGPRDGEYFPYKMPKPHRGCSCQQSVYYRFCEFSRRVHYSTFTGPPVTEYVGIVPGNSKREFSDTNGTSIGGSMLLYGLGLEGSGSSSEGDVTTMSNDEETAIKVYKGFSITYDFYRDFYTCPNGGIEVIRVKRIETKFLGFGEKKDFE